MTNAVQEKIDDARIRMLALLEELEDEIVALRRTLQHPTGDSFGVKMRTSGLELRAAQLAHFATKFVTLLELPYRLDGSRAESGRVE